MKAFLRPVDFISEDIEERLKLLEDGEKLMIEIEKDSVANTYIYSRTTGKVTE